MTKIRLGFYYHVPMYSDKQGQLRTPGYFGRFIDSLATNCDGLTCFMHSPREDEYHQMDYLLQSTNVKWVDIGPHVSVLKRIIFSKKVSTLLQEHCHTLDALLIRGPSPLLATVARAAGIPVILMLVADYLAGIDTLPQPRWRKELIRLWARWNYSQQQKVAKRALVFVNSKALYQNLSHQGTTNIHEIRTTTLDEVDFFKREDTCAHKPYRLLYTGRIASEKGIPDIIKAVSILVSSGEDITLDIVGWAEKGEDFLHQLRALTYQERISERVFFHGYKPIGPELFSFYLQADIYVIASTSSFEGFPRTIWEALAHSVPVVATAVGSIPHFLEDGISAKLTNPLDSQQLAETIRLVIHNAELRRQMIRNGFLIARENTLQKRSSELMQQIEKWLWESKRTE